MISVATPDLERPLSEAEFDALLSQGWRLSQSVWTADGNHVVLRKGAEAILAHVTGIKVVEPPTSAGKPSAPADQVAQIQAPVHDIERALSPEEAQALLGCNATQLARHIDLGRLKVIWHNKRTFVVPPAAIRAILAVGGVR